MADSVRITRVEFHNEGFNQFRKSAPVADELERRGQAIADAASAAGGEYRVVRTENNSRARVVVVTADYEAMRAEATNRSLSSALDAGRA